MIQKIVEATNLILRQKSKPVTSFDKKIKTLEKDLIDTLEIQKDPEGVGLAGVQIGKLVRIFAMVDTNKKIRVLVNPEILEIIQKRTTKKKQKKNNILEGCLSIPQIYGPLTRNFSLKLKYQDTDGNVHEEIFKGFSAQIVQHEIDHLNGILFTDHLIKEKKPVYKYENEEFERIEL